MPGREIVSRGYLQFLVGLLIHNKERKLKLIRRRREFMKQYLLKLMAGIAVLSLLFGIIPASVVQGASAPVQYNSPIEYQRATGKKIAKYNEAPKLTELVKSGQLPSVEKRLPKDPIVIVSVEEVGQYGGKARALGGIDSYGDAEAFVGWEGILRVTPDNKIIPNIAKSWKFTDSGKTLYIYLREGIKWSDGVPFTADDIMFWWEDVTLNNELTPVKPEWWTVKGKLMRMEKVNDYTIKMMFDSPYAVAVMHLAHSYGTEGRFYLPKHYLKKYHPKYTPMEDIMAVAKKEGFNSWVKLFQKHGDFYSGCGGKVDVGAPTLRPFRVAKRGLDFLSAERNPYYWKVDTAGNQLPYIDEVFVTTVSNPEVANMKIISGEIDIAQQNTSMDNYTLYMENSDNGGYRVLLWQSQLGSDVCYQVNLTYQEDPVIREIFRDLRFRKALSLAINRDEINQFLYHGMGVPRQTTVVPYSPYYEESFAKAYIEYNPKEANRLLDEMGLKRGPDGYRLRPDGKRLELVLEFSEGETPKRRTTEIVHRYWDAIGIKIVVKEEAGSLVETRILANQIQIGLWHGDRCAFLFPVVPYYWVPIRFKGECSWCPAWAQWYTSGGKAGEEPPKEIKRLLTLYERMQEVMSEKERIRLGKEILKSNAENLWTIGTVGLVPHPVIAKNNLRNVPEKGYWGWDLMRINAYHPEQFFFKQK